MGWRGLHVAGSLDDVQARLLVLKLPVTACKEKPWLDLLKQFGSKSLPSAGSLPAGRLQVPFDQGFALPFCNYPGSTILYVGLFLRPGALVVTRDPMDMLVYRSRGGPHLLLRSKETSQRPQQTSPCSHDPKASIA